jgi:hypothetical protein
MLPGKEASAKTSTACFANTSQRQRIYPCFPRNSSTASPGNSIPDQEKHSAGKLPPNCSSQKAPSTSSSTGQPSARFPLHPRAIEKWKANCASHFPTAPATGVLYIIKPVFVAFGVCTRPPKIHSRGKTRKLQPATRPGCPISPISCEASWVPRTSCAFP